MKSFIVGLLTMLVLGVVGFFTFKSTVNFMQKLNPSPSPSSEPPCASECLELLSPSPQPQQADQPRMDSPAPTYTPTVKGVSTTKTVTTTTSHLTLTLVRSSACPISYMTEVKDIKGPLTLKYSLKDNYSFGITVWAKDGNELVGNTTYSGTSGTIKTLDGVDYMKVRIESKTCSPTSDNWLTVTAER